MRSREGWLPEAARQNFAQVSILSTPAEQVRWADFFRPANPQSPQVLWGPSAVSMVDVQAISFINPKVATVRFHRSLRQGDQTTDTNWVATVSFTYAKAPMKEVDRLRNPLGFQVVTYRIDPVVTP